MKDTAFCLNIKGDLRAFDKPLIMGILNLNSDSFFDGGSYTEIENAIRHAQQLISEGADIIDLGPSSTKPGMSLSNPKDEIRKISPVLTALKHENVLISVDTYWSETAEFAIDQGAHIINDISGGEFDPKIWECCSKHSCPYILMHIHGKPENMQEKPLKKNDINKVYTNLYYKYLMAKKVGIKDVIIDPGIGFGKDIELNYELLKNLPTFTQITDKLLIGVSRKSMFYKAMNLKPKDVLPASISAHFYAMSKGAKILRTHDVGATFQSREVYLNLQ